MNIEENDQLNIISIFTNLILVFRWMNVQYVPNHCTEPVTCHGFFIWKLITTLQEVLPIGES